MGESLDRTSDGLVQGPVLIISRAEFRYDCRNIEWQAPVAQQTEQYHALYSIRRL